MYNDMSQPIRHSRLFLHGLTFHSRLSPAVTVGTASMIIWSSDYRETLVNRV